MLRSTRRSTAPEAPISRPAAENIVKVFNAPGVALLFVGALNFPPHSVFKDQVPVLDVGAAGLRALGSTDDRHGHGTDLAFLVVLNGGLSTILETHFHALLDIVAVHTSIPSMYRIALFGFTSMNASRCLQMT